MDMANPRSDACSLFERPPKEELSLQTEIARSSDATRALDVHASAADALLLLGRRFASVDPPCSADSQLLNLTTGLSQPPVLESSVQGHKRSAPESATTPPPAKAIKPGNGRKAKTSTNGKCEHGRRQSRCKECGGSGICVHGRQRTQCRDCGGGGICEHNRRRSRCKECGGNGICMHGRQNDQCKECGGAGICEHSRRRSQCKECGGTSICQHGRIRNVCKECKGASICQHQRRRRECKECRGASLQGHGPAPNVCRQATSVSVQQQAPMVFERKPRIQMEPSTMQHQQPASITPAEMPAAIRTTPSTQPSMIRYQTPSGIMTAHMPAAILPSVAPPSVLVNGQYYVSGIGQFYRPIVAPCNSSARRSMPILTPPADAQWPMQPAETNEHTRIASVPQAVLHPPYIPHSFGWSPMGKMYGSDGFTTSPAI
jgi:hypothetical protein